MKESDAKLLTVDGLANRLSVKRSWIYGETRKTGPGTIPRIKVGKYLRFSLEEVMNWLKAQQDK
jgi:excisionase family DNA binding protein